MKEAQKEVEHKECEHKEREQSGKLTNTISDKFDYGFSCGISPGHPRINFESKVTTILLSS